jgi:oligoendopeptidase F
MNCDTTNHKYAEEFDFFIREIEPFLAPVSDSLNRKTLDCRYTDQLTEPGYQIMFRNMKRSTELFREENIELNTKISNESQKYGAISSAQTIEHEGQQITLQKAATFLKSQDRSLRESIYKKIQDRKSQDENQLNEFLQSRDDGMNDLESFYEREISDLKVSNINLQAQTHFQKKYHLFQIRILLDLDNFLTILFPDIVIQIQYSLI